MRQPHLGGCGKRLANAFRRGIVFLLRRPETMTQRLPNELIAHIFSFVDPEDRTTLAALCRSSWALHQIATPLLYGVVGIPRSDLEPAERYGRLQLLCKTLLKNPSLARHAREVKHYIDGRITTLGDPMVPMADNEKARIAHLLRVDMNLPFGLLEPIVAQVISSRMSEEAFFMLLMLICPNLHTLHLQGWLHEIDAMPLLNAAIQYISQAGSQDTTSNNEFGDGTARSHDAGIYKIRNLVVERREDFEFGIMLGLGGRLLRLPALRTYSALGFSLPPSQQPATSVCCIQEINLDRFCGEISDLEVLLRATPELKTLNIKWSDLMNNYWRPDWRVLCEFLRKYCPGLQHLHIKHSRHTTLDVTKVPRFASDEAAFPRDRHLPGMGALHDLKHLEKLTLSTIALFGTHRGDDFDWEEYEASGMDMTHYLKDQSARPKRTLESLLPESLRELTVLGEYEDLGEEDKAILDEPGASRLEHLCIMNRQGDYWISKRYHQGSSGSQPDGYDSPPILELEDGDEDEDVDNEEDIAFEKGLANGEDLANEEDLVNDADGLPQAPQASHASSARFAEISAELGPMAELFDDDMLQDMDRIEPDIWQAVVLGMMQDAIQSHGMGPI